MGSNGFVSDQIGRRAAITPGRVVVEDLDTGRTYAARELDGRANRLANALVDGLGLEPGDRVAVLSRNRVEYLDCFFATQKVGLILVPLNVRLAVPELRRQLADTEPQVLFFESPLAELAAEIADCCDHLVEVEASRGGSSLPGARTLETLTAGARDLPPRCGAASLEDPHLILYTGGTTGLPKGAVLSHRAVLANVLSEIISWQLGPQDVSVLLLPMFHTGGWLLVNLPLIFAGGRVLISRTFDPERTLRVVAEKRCTLLFGAATMYHMMLGTADFSRVDLSSLRFVMSGAAPCPRQVMEPFWERGVSFVQGYGITEGGPNNLYMPWYDLTPEQIRERWQSVGIPFVYCRARVAYPGGPPEEGRPRPGELGELLLSGPQVFSGYWRNPEATADTLREGWVWTGDIVAQDEDGFFYIRDRRKDMFISGGENVFPVEVETVLQAHPAVSEVAVIGVPDPKWGEVGKAFVVLHPGYQATAEDLIAFCQGKLARYKIPRYVAFVPSLPRSAVGKVLKTELRRLG